MRPSPGYVVGGKYRIVRLIGDGGMGAVFEARHEVLGSPVALKFLHSELTRRPGLASRFLQEARVSASIQSPHVTRVTDVDQTNEGSPYLVMELLVGESLQELLDRTIKLPRDQAVDFALQILSGLEAAHALGVVHRDLKPDNVFVTPSGGGPVVKLLDFGIAKLRESSEFQKGLTRPGAVMGTPEYMAPEQLYSADKVDHRADLYSLGAILYEMLTGERPAYGDDAPEIIAQVAMGKVKPLREHEPALPQGLADVVHRAIAADRDQRFASAQRMRLALAPFAGALSHAGQLAATPAPVTGPPNDAPSSTATASTAQPTRKTPELTEDDEPPSGVPPTLPPEADPDGMGEASTDLALGKGATQDAPRPPMQNEPHSSPQPGTTDPGGGPAALRPFAGGGYGAVPPAPPGARRRRSAAGGLIALLLGVLITGGVIAAVVLTRSSDDDDLPLPPIDSAPPAVTLSPLGSTDPPPSSSPPPLPGTTPVAGTSAPPKRPRDVGTGADAGIPPFSLPPLPSSLPPLPSSLPPFPSSLPPLPSSLPPLPFPMPTSADP